MNIIAWTVFGILAGIVAHYSDNREAKGGKTLVGAILVGILGALSGGLFAMVLFGEITSSFDIFSFILAISASLIILLIHRSVFSIRKVDSD